MCAAGAAFCDREEEYEYANEHCGDCHLAVAPADERRVVLTEGDKKVVYHVQLPGKGGCNGSPEAVAAWERQRGAKYAKLLQSNAQMRADAKQKGIILRLAPA